ncbi:MAG: HAD family hydrolase [Sandaracinaceae bacterium]
MHVLFDLDGTLIDTHALYAASYRGAMAELLETPPTYEEMMGLRPASEREFLLRWKGPELGDRLHRRMLEIYTERAATLLGGFFDGVPELLVALRDRGIRTGIVTGKSRAAYDVTATQLPLEGFETVVYEDDVEHPKPDPEGIHIALERMGLEPSRTLYLGDTPMDAEAAAAAGVQPVAALWCRPEADRARVVERLSPEVWALSEPRELLARL